MEKELQTLVAEDTVRELSSIDTITIGILPENSGLVMQIPSGGIDDRYMSGNTRRHLTLQFLCKDSQQQAYNRLCAVVNHLEALRVFLPRNGYRMVSYQADTGPQLVGFEKPAGMAIYIAVVLAYYHC